jgi:outer membrane immunogenic protein
MAENSDASVSDQHARTTLSRAATALSIAVIAALTGAHAWAADLPVKAPPVPTLAPVFSWTGFYVGGNLGAKWATASDTVNVAPATAFGAALPFGASLPLSSTSPSSFMGGAQVGYNWQTGPVVFGIEGDIDVQDWKTTQVLTNFSSDTVFVPGDSFTLDSRWQASLRGRVGYALDRLLIYATGGVAWTDVTAGANFIPFGGAPATAGTDRAILTGGTIGGGLEFALWDHVSLGVEARYTRYASHTFDGGTLALGFAPYVFAPVTQAIQPNTVEIIERLNWRF